MSSFASLVLWRWRRE